MQACSSDTQNDENVLPPASAVLPYVNIAAYKFISFHDTVEQRPIFRALCEQLDLKGTILLTPEGINLFLAGLRESIDKFLAWLRSDPRFAAILRRMNLPS